VKIKLHTLTSNFFFDEYFSMLKDAIVDHYDMQLSKHADILYIHNPVLYKSIQSLRANEKVVVHYHIFIDHHLVKDVLESADMVIVSSKHLKDKYEEAYDIDDIHVLYPALPDVMHYYLPNRYIDFIYASKPVSRVVMNKLYRQVSVFREAKSKEDIDTLYSSAKIVLPSKYSHAFGLDMLYAAKHGCIPVSYSSLLIDELIPDEYKIRRSNRIGMTSVLREYETKQMHKRVDTLIYLANKYNARYYSEKLYNLLLQLH